jgi:hypothetical protein
LIIHEEKLIGTIQLLYKAGTFDIDYFSRGEHKETILFIHGLGGAKENY